MELGLTGKVALITEATTKIGEAIAQSLAEEGARLVIVGSDGAELTRAAERLKGQGAEVLPIRSDGLDQREAKRLVAETIARFGKIDVLVLNSDAEVTGTIEEVPVEAVAGLVQRKLLGPWELARAAAPHLRGQESGRIVVLISDAAKVPHKARIASALVGAAQHAFVKSLSDDLGPDNVLVTGVSVGHIGPPSAGTAQVERNIYVSRSLEQQEAGWAADVPLGRWGTPGDVANAVAFLASDRSSFICGSNLDVDGGDQRMIF
ncbi:SDR family NAD(P)-dependent oxidoreductase [Bosea caraganae]|uniref:SDR family NAD(P)-dependent oxidoreductase n=1 Tax=Bosea caraganae TaxID=2763117 RepID=A0A370L992_9HYPH|nr:SDR family oxidoreductase [Bosea caraganae]RDJ26953.1 SDR family NAD(P)-dependent oxidoreductase [Bosea caraganae]RDJ30840.1 SDR family NAD(P)-dependent oxidoreductase [Bosea caraganae]